MGRLHHVIVAIIVQVINRDNPQLPLLAFSAALLSLADCTRGARLGSGAQLCMNGCCLIVRKGSHDVILVNSHVVDHEHLLASQARPSRQSEGSLGKQATELVRP